MTVGKPWGRCGVWKHWRRARLEALGTGQTPLGTGQTPIPPTPSSRFGAGSMGKHWGQGTAVGIGSRGTGDRGQGIGVFGDRALRTGGPPDGTTFVSFASGSDTGTRTPPRSTCRATRAPSCGRSSIVGPLPTHRPVDQHHLDPVHHSQSLPGACGQVAEYEVRGQGKIRPEWRTCRSPVGLRGLFSREFRRVGQWPNTKYGDRAPRAGGRNSGKGQIPIPRTRVPGFGSPGDSHPGAAPAPFAPCRCRRSFCYTPSGACGPQTVPGRGMAQSGSAPALGAGSRGFKSLCPDHLFSIVYGNQEGSPKRPLQTIL